MARAKTGLDKQNSILPIVIIGVTIAIVVGLIVGALWGIASSGNKSANIPSPLPTVSITSASPTPTPTTPSPTPTTTSASPTQSASPTLTTSPTPTVTPTVTTSAGVPAWHGADVAASGTWNIGSYSFGSDGSGNFKIVGTVVNGGASGGVGHFTLYLYLRSTGKYLGTASATQFVGKGTAGVAITFASSTRYVVGAGLIFVAS